MAPHTAQSLAVIIYPPQGVAITANGHLWHRTPPNH